MFELTTENEVAGLVIAGVEHAHGLEACPEASGANKRSVGEEEAGRAPRVGAHMQGPRLPRHEVVLLSVRQLLLNVLAGPAECVEGRVLVATVHEDYRLGKGFSCVESAHLVHQWYSQVEAEMK